jgi:hypothetical protein
MSFTVSGTTVIDSSRNIVNAVAGTFSGTVTSGLFNATGNTGVIAVNNAGNRKLEVACDGTNNSAGNAAYMTFHRPNAFAVRFGLDTTNRIRVGGWSLGNVAYDVILGDSFANPSTTAFTATNQLLLKNGTASNPTAIVRNDGNDIYLLLTNASTAPNQSFNSLRPLLINTTTGLLRSDNGQSFSGTTTVNGTLVFTTGTGNLTGTVTNSTQTFNNNWNTDFTQAPAGSTILRGDTPTGSATGGPGGTWWFQQNMRHNNGSNFWGVQVAWGWEDNAHKLRTRNWQNGVATGWVEYLNSVNYNSFAPTLTGGNASGTWGINITGNAGNSSLLQGLNVQQVLISPTTGTGSYHLLRLASGSANIGDSVAGSNLYRARVNSSGAVTAGTTTVPGTYRLQSGSISSNEYGLWQRVG